MPESGRSGRPPQASWSDFLYMKGIRSARAFGKEMAYRTGMFGVAHRLRNRCSVTAVIFHRVLPREHPAWRGAGPAWTVLDTVFRDCLHFFSDHYTAISLQGLLDACADAKPLPPRPLLITFDDGWADTAEYALPILQEARMPATVFVVSDCVGRYELWQDTIVRTWHTRALQPCHFVRMWKATEVADRRPVPSSWDDISAVWSLIGRLSLLTPA